MKKILSVIVFGFVLNAWASDHECLELKQKFESNRDIAKEHILKNKYKIDNELIADANGNILGRLSEVYSMVDMNLLKDGNSAFTNYLFSSIFSEKPKPHFEALKKLAGEISKDRRITTSDEVRECLNTNSVAKDK